MNNYEDIIYLNHLISMKHPRMSIENRAAQFAPFAALTGYGEAVKETARITDKRIEIDEGLKNVINEKLKLIEKDISNRPKVTITYFVYDDKKSGGKYIKKIGNVKKIDLVKHLLIMIDKTKIPIKEIIDIL